MKKTKILMLGLVTLLLLLTIAPIAQSKIKPVTGGPPLLVYAVLSEDGKNINVWAAVGQLPTRALIKVLDKDGALVDKGFTDSDGFKSFKAPDEPGVYTIRAEKRGFLPAETEIIIPGDNIPGNNA